MLVIDTEGFGATDCHSNEGQDRNIFILAALLSSYLIFNTNENINENSLNTFQFITGLARDLVKDHENPEEFFPSFMWLLRDFHL